MIYDDFLKGKPRTPAEDEQLGASIIKPKRVEYRYRVAGWTYRTIEQERVVHSMFEEQDLKAFLANGFLLVDRAFDEAQLSELRRAVDEQAQQHLAKRGAKGNDNTTDRCIRTDGLDEATRILLKPEPIIDSVRSLLGPNVTCRDSVSRVTYPGDVNPGAPWHLDHKINVTPRPPLSSECPAVTVVVYLDDITEANGPTVVVPGSHLWEDTIEVDEWGIIKLDELGVQAEPSRLEDLPGSFAMPTVKAGSVLFIQSSLWHRVGVKADENSSRRVLVSAYSDAFTRRAYVEPAKPKPGSVAAALLAEAQENGDEGMLELLGQARTWW